MLDKLRITAKNSFVYSLGNLATKLVGLFLLPLYTKEFTIEEYGVVGLMDVTIRILVAILGLNLFNAFFRWYWDKDLAQKRDSLFFTVLVAVIIVASVISAVFVFFGDTLANLLFENEKFSLVLKLAIVSAATETICVIPFTLLRLQGKAGKFTTTSLIRLLVNVGLNVLLIVKLRLGIESIYIASIAGSIVFLLTLIPYMLKNLSFRFEFVILKSMLHYSVPLLLASITGIILSITDRYVIQFITGLGEVGTYSLGFKLANTIRFLIIMPINMAVLPLFYKIIGEEGSKRFYARFTTYYTFLVGITVLGMSLFAEYVVKLFAQSSDYYSSYLVVPFLSFGILFGMLKDMSLTGLHIRRQTGNIAIITITMALLNLGLNILLIPRFKGVGASVATLIVQFLFFVIVLIVAQKRYHIPYEIRRIVIIAINIVVLFIISKLFSGFSMPVKLILNFILILVYPLTLFLAGFYEDREFAGILGFIRKWKNPARWKDELVKLAQIKEDE